jgi:hypothetical protein
MAWSPPARQRRSWLVEQAGDYATQISYQTRDGTLVPRSNRTPEDVENFDRFWLAVARYYRRFGAEVPVAAHTLSSAEAASLAETIKKAVLIAGES